MYRTQDEVSDVMRRVKGKDTKPEMLLRKALWSRGLRYRVSVTSLPGKPDIVFPTQRLAVFVDGDFWHGNQWKRRRLGALDEQFAATGNREYWLRKIGRTIDRDRERTRELIDSGWRVIRFWESDLLRDVEGSADMVADALRRPDAIDLRCAPHRTAAEFFAGIGLMRMGLERAKWSVVFANDIDSDKLAMYSTHFGESDDFLLADIHTISGDAVPSTTIATASFPCNDLSLAGARGGLAGKHSSAFWGFVRILDEMGARRPPIVLLENVPGFLTSHDGADLESALAALNDLGYAVDVLMVDAASFVPQSRLRMFIIGSRAPRPEAWRVRESPASYEGAVRPRALAEFITTHPEIRWEIRPMPPLPARTIGLADIIEDLPPSAGEWWNTERAEYLLSQMSPRHRAVADEMIRGPRWSYGTVFRRVRSGKSMAELRTDGVAGCLRTPRGGSGRQVLLQAGGGEVRVRLLTPRECARLMGADDFTIDAPASRAFFGFGDAVCVPAVAWIAENYLNPLVNELMRGCVLG